MAVTPIKIPEEITEQSIIANLSNLRIQFDTARADQVAEYAKLTATETNPSGKTLASEWFNHFNQSEAMCNGGHKSPYHSRANLIFLAYGLEKALGSHPDRLNSIFKLAITIANKPHADKKNDANVPLICEKLHDSLKEFGLMDKDEPTPNYLEDDADDTHNPLGHVA